MSASGPSGPLVFIELVQYANYLGGKSRKKLVEHKIIKNDKKIK